MNAISRIAHPPPVPEDDDDTPPYIRTPHPLECRRLRPRREPRYLPKRRPRTAPRTRRSAVERWYDPRLEAAPDTGQIRINFKYGHWFSTTAGFSVKSQRAVFHEGPTECAAWIEAETLTSRLDLEFQPLRVVWRRDHGKTRHITLDGGFELEDHSIVFTEYKGHRAYFDEDDTADLLDEAEEVLAQHGATLRREDASELVGTMLHRTLKDVFDDRNTKFEWTVDVAAAREAVLREGGATPIGKVWEAIGGDVRDAAAKLNAMSVRRLVRIDPTLPQMPDTLVDLPPERMAHNLRAFLKHHAMRDDEGVDPTNGIEE